MAWDEETTRRTTRRWRIAVDRQILTLQPMLGLTKEQSRRFEAILMERPIPFDPRSVEAVTGDAYHGMGLVALARADRDRLLAIVDEARRKTLEDHLAASRNVEQMLRVQKAIDE